MRLLIVAGALLTAAAVSAQQPYRDTAAVTALLAHLRDPDSVVRNTALATLHRDSADLLLPLSKMLHGKDVKRQAAAAEALIMIGLPALPAIREALADTGPVAFTMVEDLTALPREESDALALLVPLLSDTRPAVRSRTVQAANGYRRGGAETGRLLARLLTDSDASVRRDAAYAMIDVRDSASRVAGIPLLVQLTRDADSAVRREAVHALGNMGDVSGPAVPALVERIRVDSVLEIAWLSARVLGWLGPRASVAVPDLLGHVNDPRPQVRVESLGALGGIGVTRLSPDLRAAVLDTLRVHLHSRQAPERRRAVEALAAIGPPAIPALAGAVQSRDDSVAFTAVVALGQLPDDHRIVAPLFGALSDARLDVRNAAADALGGARADTMARVRALGSAASRRALAVAAASRSLPIAWACYRVTYGSGAPDEVGRVHAPRTLRFATARSDPKRMEFFVEQWLAGDWRMTGYWEPNAAHHSVTLNPSPELSGVTLTFDASSAAELHGTIETYWDFRAKTDTASATAHRVDCAKP
jgi:HEAT repeat protein